MSATPGDELTESSIAEMKNHVIVMGYKLLGTYVVEKLKEMGLNYVILVKDETQLPMLRRNHMVVVGSPIARSFQTLKTAGASKASTVICTFEDDGDNMLSILNAKKINPKIRAITVVNDRDLVEAATASGADVVLAPFELTGQLLAMSSVSEGVSALFVRGELKSKQISEFTIGAGSRVSYLELTNIAPVVMVSRGDRLITDPEDEFAFEAGDTIYAVTDRDSLLALEEELFRRRLISQARSEPLKNLGSEFRQPDRAMTRRWARAGVRRSLFSRIGDFVDLLFWGPLSILRKIWVQLVLLVFMFAFGTAIFFHYQHLNLLTAFVGSVSTITTIGIYDPSIIGMSQSEQILLAITFIASVGLAASLVQAILSSVVSRDIIRKKRVTKQIGYLRDHVIVAGYSYMGKYAAQWLSQMKVGYVIITVDASLTDSLQASGELAIHSPAARSFEALKEADVQKASTLICALDDDGDNLLVAMNARKQNKDLRILTVVNDRELVESARASSGIDVVIPIFDLVANVLAVYAVAPEIAGIFIPSTLDSQVKPSLPYIAEFSIVSKAGATFDALNKVAPILLVTRNHKIIPNPGRTFVFEHGDSLFMMASTHESIEEFRKLLA